MSENVTVAIPVVTVTHLNLPRWVTPFARHLFGIPTHMTLAERMALLQAALELPSGFSVLEIGSYVGASTAFFGFAALRGSGTVHAVDPWTNEAMGAEGSRDTFGDFQRHTEPFAHYIVPHRGYSADVNAREGPLACDLLFIDGDHSYAAVLADLTLWLPSLKPAGLLLMHDIDQPEVRRAFDDVLGESKLLSPLRIVDRLLLARPRRRLTPRAAHGMILEPKQGRETLTGCLRAIRSQPQETRRHGTHDERRCFGIPFFCFVRSKAHSTTATRQRPDPYPHRSSHRR